MVPKTIALPGCATPRPGQQGYPAGGEEEERGAWTGVEPVGRDFIIVGFVAPHPARVPWHRARHADAGRHLPGEGQRAPSPRRKKLGGFGWRISPPPRTLPPQRRCGRRFFDLYAWVYGPLWRAVCPLWDGRAFQEAQIRRVGRMGVARGPVLVGAAGFEPTASCPPDKRATRLRHAPKRGDGAACGPLHPFGKTRGRGFPKGWCPSSRALSPPYPSAPGAASPGGSVCRPAGRGGEQDASGAWGGDPRPARERESAPASSVGGHSCVKKGRRPV